jgi:hypothetical protein
MGRASRKKRIRRETPEREFVVHAQLASATGASGPEQGKKD